ncbi:MAG TPA: DUF4143 domain-containing protein [candidate division Zixibacteria bacterium]|nr:DUF4143 domain-containing protein [candidate division Zixibacteria bacterium]
MADLPYQRRVVDIELDELLSGVAAVSLEGPRAVGKTRTGMERAATAYRLDLPETRAVLTADPRRVAVGDRPVLVDEWQVLPETWDAVRHAVDADRTPGQFILTGSAAPREAPVHPGAGRIVSLRMRPMSLAERGVGPPTVSLRTLLSGRRPAVEGQTGVSLDDYAREIVQSGLPGLRGLPSRAIRAQLDGYIDQVIDRDFKELGGRSVRNPAALRRWLRAYAAAVSTTVSYEKIRDAATAGHDEKPTKVTVLNYLDTLERLWLIEPVPAWAPSGTSLRRLAGGPKHQLADPALAARLLGVHEDALLAGESGMRLFPGQESLLGALFESLVGLNLRVYAQVAEARVSHFRTRGGDHEIDFIIERPDQGVVAVEVKLARTIRDVDVRHVQWLRERIGDRLLDAVVISTGPEAYRRTDGVAVVPAVLLGP